MSVSGFVPSSLGSRSAATTLALPPRPAPPPRPGVPWLACVVPVVGAVGFWAVTGSVFALWFAALGPLIAIAGLLDGRRTARRRRREEERAAAEARERLGAQLAQRHLAERAALRMRHPDVAGYLERRDRIWRPVPERDRVLVIGEGEVESAVRVSAPADPHPDDAAFLERARMLPGAPVAVPLGSGVAVVGPEVLARAVVRSLVLQLALAHPPGRVRIDGSEPWLSGLPHRAVHAETTVAVGRASDALPEAGTIVVTAAAHEPLPPRCGIVLTLTSIDRAHAEIGAEGRDVTVEAVGEQQAAAIVDELAARALSAAPKGVDEGVVALAGLRASERRRSRAALPVAIGRTQGEPVEIDVVRDGPHAVVTGMTGAGKSELLVSWVLALCAAYRTDDVAFLLADFKGGTAFDQLAGLPHVTGVITDLDEATARRAIESLRAEIRHREQILARFGARDIADVDLPRLVVVVDEFAALRETQPELEGLFADIAARGRALGMHLIVGSQRAAGVFRDALLANCALRISLRVADRLDSRALVGSDEAAELPGDETGRGLALVRRSGDARPARVRIALSDPVDVLAAGGDAGPRPRAPWLPSLPTRLPLDDLRDGEPGLILGLVDDPAHQRQEPWRLGTDDRGLLVVGGPGSGTSTALRALAAQLPPAAQHWIGPDPEQLWDALTTWPPRVLAAGATVFVDDLDQLLSRLPDEHARAASDALEHLVRDAAGRGVRVVAAAHRLAGVAGRVADLLPRRLILPTAGRADHVAAGGEPAGFALCTRPGRGVVGGLAIQVATTTAVVARTAPAAPVWEPPAGASGFVTRASSTDARIRWERQGVRLRAVDDPHDPCDDPAGRTVLIGTPEQWIGRPRTLERVRAARTLVVDAACERDLRMLTGERSLAPYAAPGRGRGWVCGGDEPPARVTVDPAAGA